MSSLVSPLRTAAAVAAVVLGANVGIAAASAKTDAKAKTKVHHVVAHKKKKAEGHKATVSRASKKKAPAKKYTPPKTTTPAKTTTTTTTTPKATTTPVTTTPTSTTAKTTATPTTPTTATPTTPTTTTTSKTTTTPTTTTPTTTTPTTTTPTTTTPTTTTPTTTTPTTTTPTTTTPTTTTPSSTPVPNGPTGNFSMVFDDEFNGTSLNKTSWADHSGYTSQNNVTDSSSNLSVANGDLTLNLASATSGEAIETNAAALNVGDYAEARIDFAGSGTSIYNWPAFWAAGPGWPASGEQDIMEGLGRATVNYHYAVNGNNTQAGPFNIPGTWSNGFHTYGVYRGTNYCDVYWDGQLVKTYPTDDNGNPEYLILEMGASNTLAFGSQGQMVVDYVREWKQS
jgi:hypothetical protein